MKCLVYETPAASEEELHARVVDVAEEIQYTPGIIEHVYGNMTGRHTISATHVMAATKSSSCSAHSIWSRQEPVLDVVIRWINRFVSWWGRSRIFACVNRPGRCSSSAGFLRDLPFSSRLYYIAATYSPLFALNDSQDLSVKSRLTHSTPFVG
ncbi:hypothetical protein PR048_010988 [Dryococelus australis]|uniref:Uncharacterized protein n=1 Tax=Dryococelus australis TaxID=614101 RepID=A0ABQ9HKE8_9NEOP|nr:hypothetical protein PR048_010988 [Dryococelus australis]